MKAVLSMMLGIMTAIGGFVDIGNLVTSGITGARFGLTLAWAVLVGTIGMALFAEMAGRVTAVTRKRSSMWSASGSAGGYPWSTRPLSTLLNVLTLAAEIGGVSLVLEMATGISYLIWVPLVGLFAWLVVWRMPFQWMENIFGLLGLGLIVFVIALFRLPTNWPALWHQATHPAVPAGQPAPTWWFYAVTLVGACIVPYQVIFFSSGGREEGWTSKDLTEMRVNAFIGFPLGGLLSLAIVAAALGKTGLAIVFVSFFAATFAAAAECTLSSGYSVAQYMGWSWGKRHPPGAAARFHLVCLASVIAATAFTLTTIDPVTVTIFAVVLGAAAVPLTYFPILIVANDTRLMGQRVNRRWSNAAGTFFLLIMVVVSLASLPLLLLTKAASDRRTAVTRWEETEFTANDLLLDRELIDSRGMPAGRVDDLELTIGEPGQPPVLTALLCGPTAFGPRLGGRLGTWWQAIGRRLRPVSDSYPNRIDAALLDHVDRLEITLLTPRENLGSYRFRRWAEEKVIGRIPGSGK